MLGNKKRSPQTYSLPQEMHDWFAVIGGRDPNSNRSRKLEHYVKLGRQAELSGMKLDPAKEGSLIPHG